MPTRVPVELDRRAPHEEMMAYLVGDTNLLVVDPGGDPETLRAAIDGRRVGHVAVTHHHRDHVGALAELVADLADEQATPPTVWARQGRAGAFAEATGIDPDRTLAPGDAISVAGTNITAVDTPGHAAEHLAFRTPEGWLVGDLAVADGSVVVGGQGADMRAYLTSLRRVRASAPARLYPGHGPIIEHVTAACDRLIAHRLDREQRVRDAVAGGARTVDAVLAAAYEKDLSGVRDLARQTVRAHLDKLAREGDVVLEGDAVHPA
jgi:ribonuclease/clavin/mitogillin